MHGAPARDEEIVRTARIHEGADADRNDRQVLVAWSAGFVDGEGYIGIAPNKGGHGSRSLTLVLMVSQINPRPIEVLKDLYGGTVVVVAPKPPRRQVFQWKVSARQAAAALTEMLPYLIGKRDQAIVGLTFQVTLRPNSGVRLTDEEIAERESFRDQLQDMHGLVR